jgi:hypothetical protein
MIVVEVPCRKKQCNCSLVCQVKKIFDLGFSSQFAAIALFEFLPTIECVAELTAQLGARCNFPEPQIGMDSLFAQTAGPEPIHQNSDAIVSY